MTGEPLKTIVLDLLEQASGLGRFFAEISPTTERVAIGDAAAVGCQRLSGSSDVWYRCRLTAIQQHPELRRAKKTRTSSTRGILRSTGFALSQRSHAEAERAYTELITTISHLGEEDLTAPGRFPFHFRGKAAVLPSS